MAAHIILRSVAERVALIGGSYPPYPDPALGYEPIVTTEIYTDEHGFIVNRIGIDYVASGKRDKRAENLGDYALRDLEICQRDAIAVAKNLNLRCRTASGLRGWMVVFDPKETAENGGDAL